jgi:hypothetical protein
MQSVAALKDTFRKLYKEHHGEFPKQSQDMVSFINILLDKFASSPGELVPCEEFLHFIRHETALKQQASLEATDALIAPINQDDAGPIGGNDPFLNITPQPAASIQCTVDVATRLMQEEDSVLREELKEANFAFNTLKAEHAACIAAHAACIAAEKQATSRMFKYAKRLLARIIELRAELERRKRHRDLPRKLKSVCLKSMSWWMNPRKCRRRRGQRSGR